MYLVLTVDFPNFRMVFFHSYVCVSEGKGQETLNLFESAEYAASWFRQGLIEVLGGKSKQLRKKPVIPGMGRFFLGVPHVIPIVGWCSSIKTT